MDSNAFRRDLYYRVVYEIHIPPLRERPEDILPLLKLHLPNSLDQLGYSQRVALRDDGGLESLTSHSWPGNVRELKSLIDRTLARTPENLTVLTTTELARNLKRPRHP